MKRTVDLILQFVIVSIFAILVVALFDGIVMLRGGGDLVMRTLVNGQVAPPLRLPMGLVYGAIPFSGAIFLYYCALFGFELANGRMPKGPETASVGGPLG